MRQINMTLMKALIKKTRHGGASLRSITHLLQTGSDGISKNESGKISFRLVLDAGTGFFFSFRLYLRTGPD